MTGKKRYSEIKDRIDIDLFEEAIGFQLISTHGGNDIGYCVFPQNHTHGDTTGKFAIHRDKRVYNCFACGGGSLLSLAMEFWDLDMDGATEKLSEFVNAPDTQTNTQFCQELLLELADDARERAESVPYFNPRVLDRFNGPVDYFRSRGISDEVIEAYHLCYGEYIMKPAPIKQGREGPIKIDEDYFGPCAVFPHYWQGQLVGWQHRWMEWDETRSKTPKWLAKYTNTTDFPKHDTLFNYDEAKKSIEPVIVVESVPTVLFLVSNGFQAVSHFGGDPKEPQLRLLRRFSQGVILAPDNDKVGDSFTRTVGQYLDRYIPVWIAAKVGLGPKADLGDYVKTENPVENLIDHLQNHIYKLGIEI